MFCLNTCQWTPHVKKGLRALYCLPHFRIAVAGVILIKHEDDGNVYLHTIPHSIVRSSPTLRMQHRQSITFRCNSVTIVLNIGARVFVVYCPSARIVSGLCPFTHPIVAPCIVPLCPVAFLYVYNSRFPCLRNQFPAVLEVPVRYTCETTICTVASKPISDYHLHTLPPNRPEFYPIPTSSSTSSPLGRHLILALNPSVCLL